MESSAMIPSRRFTSAGVIVSSPRRTAGDNARDCAPSVRAGMTDSNAMMGVRMSDNEGSRSATTALRWKIRDASAQQRLDPDLDRFGDRHSKRSTDGQAGLVLRGRRGSPRASRRPPGPADARPPPPPPCDAPHDRAEDRAGYHLLLVG